MKIAILVSAYKAAQFIEPCLRSIRMQTLRRGLSVDLIMISDGCKESWSAIKNDPTQGTKICLRENVGVYRAFNTGLALIEDDTDLIGFIGADDVWDHRRLSEIYDMAQGKVGHHAFACHYKTIDEQGRVIGTVRKHCPTGHFFYSKAVFDDLGGFQPWQCGADTEFWVRAQRMGTSFHCSTKPLFHYRIHPDQLTQTESLTNMTPERRRAKAYIDELRKSNDLRLLGRLSTVERGKIKHASGDFSRERKRAISRLR